MMIKHLMMDSTNGMSPGLESSCNFSRHWDRWWDNICSRPSGSFVKWGPASENLQGWQIFFISSFDILSMDKIVFASLIYHNHLSSYSEKVHVNICYNHYNQSTLVSIHAYCMCKCLGNWFKNMKIKLSISLSIHNCKIINKSNSWNWRCDARLL